MPTVRKKQCVPVPVPVRGLCSYSVPSRIPSCDMVPATCRLGLAVSAKLDNPLDLSTYLFHDGSMSHQVVSKD